MEKYSKRLQGMLNNFHLGQALCLSDEIHEAESHGYEVSGNEDRLWERLTARIEEMRGYA
jgi:hypothetical protein